ncbi:hypothetical protein [Luteipulveratus halotolerans]|uniref:Uncharacterized protein n=1 Tax=Luteipulveratus halotolerans TaxID=1631356 RepID=A0A0L6CE50_9MICO|nr:hypothetical protein [Luteipulveratus halotolerans]KNX36082.1 hypothetical protein VV01_01230 [Luteipulveratus halotolerans]
MKSLRFVFAPWLRWPVPYVSWLDGTILRYAIYVAVLTWGLICLGAGALLYSNVTAGAWSGIGWVVMACAFAAFTVMLRALQWLLGLAERHALG